MISAFAASFPHHLSKLISSRISLTIKGKPSLIVVELDRDKNRVILSHRAVVEKEQTAKKHDFLQTLEVGSVLEGKVGLTDFGAFVDIGGIDGLVHISRCLIHTSKNRLTWWKKVRT